MKISDVASREELAPFNRKSNWKGARLVILNWACVATIFAVVARWTNPLTIVAALFLLGGRQMAFAALMHDCGHGLLFESPWANRHIGQWLCAYPVLSDQPRYARGHLKHHAWAGTTKDPDLPNYHAYPITRASFRRKIVRDLTGQTGWRSLKATWRRGKADLGKAPWKGNALAGHLIVNGALFAVLAATGHGLLFLLWPAAFLTTYMLIARLRQVAEHGATPDLYDLDPRLNTRTVYVRWWEKLFVAPFDLNYHLEHHLMASVPCYNLKTFHRFLKQKGCYAGTFFPRGYGELFATVLKG
jgi:fatty acid desaturase